MLCFLLYLIVLFEQIKCMYVLETVKLAGVHSKINAISLNIKINKQKSVGICGYKLSIHVQNFMQKHSPQAKISSKVVGGLLF